MKCSRQKEQPSSEPAADSSQSETLHRTVSAIAGHQRRKKLTSILARLSNKVEVPWEEGRAQETRTLYAHGERSVLVASRSSKSPSRLFQSAVSGTCCAKSARLSRWAKPQKELERGGACACDPAQPAGWKPDAYVRCHMESLCRSPSERHDSNCQVCGRGIASIFPSRSGRIVREKYSRLGEKPGN